MQKLVIGCGYLGRRVAEMWQFAGGDVAVMTRSNSSAGFFEGLGLQPVVADVTEPDSLRNLPAVDTVLYAVGYDRTAGKGMRAVYVEGLRNVLNALPDSVRRIIYISSTSVYAQSDGQWIDEDSPCEPVRENGRICLEAENVLREHRFGPRSIILRLAGIYGPGRIPRRDALIAGEPIAAPRDGWLNLIHVEDAVRIVLASARLSPPRLYTVSDGSPPQRHAYYEELARLLNAPPPTFVEPPADSPAALRAESNKRVSNHRLLAELKVTLNYPTYREGLAAIVASEAAGEGTNSR